MQKKVFFDYKVKSYAARFEFPYIFVFNNKT